MESIQWENETAKINLSSRSISLSIEEFSELFEIMMKDAIKNEVEYRIPEDEDECFDEWGIFKKTLSECVPEIVDEIYADAVFVDENMVSNYMNKFVERMIDT